MRARTGYASYTDGYGEKIGVGEARKIIGSHTDTEPGAVAKKIARHLKGGMPAYAGYGVYLDENGDYLRTADPGCWYKTTDQKYVLAAGTYRPWEVEVLMKTYDGSLIPETLEEAIRKLGIHRIDVR
jgi:hypothetical protein